MISTRFFLLISTALLLTGCASQSNDAGNQSQPLHPASSHKTYIETSSPSHPKEVVTQYIPVALPGQLMPTPHTQQTAEPKFANPKEAVDYANKNALLQPSTSHFFNSMMTYDYSEGALYTLYTAPLKITDISLAPGEKLISEAAGDTLRWQIAQTYSGSGSTLTQHILVKPNQANLQNTMLITTDQHVYHLVLLSTDQSYMVSVSWSYPHNMVSYAENTPGPTADPSSLASSTPNVDVSKLSFNYAYSVLKGKKPSWYPLRVFNDGKQTFIQLPSDYTSSEMPILYVADDNGAYATMINWRYHSPYIIVDTVLKEARLQTGVAETGLSIVQIQQNEAP